MIVEPRAGLDAIVVVDHTLFPLSAGGSRMAADVTEDFLGPAGEGDTLPLWAQTYEGMDMDGLATGQGVCAAAEVALERLGRSLAGATVAIEGFGKVGAGAAVAFSRAGAGSSP